MKHCVYRCEARFSGHAWLAWGGGQL